MEKTQHTKGPWRPMSEIPGRTTDIKAMANVTVARVNRFGDITRAAGQLSPQEEAEANAHLIAAAPDLLEALLDCLPDLEHYVATHGPGPDKRLGAARAAIARATKGA